jgi:hypothetical protein
MMDLLPVLCGCERRSVVERSAGKVLLVTRINQPFHPEGVLEPTVPSATTTPLSITWIDIERRIYITNWLSSSRTLFCGGRVMVQSNKSTWSHLFGWNARGLTKEPDAGDIDYPLSSSWAFEIHRKC